MLLKVRSLIIVSLFTSTVALAGQPAAHPKKPGAATTETKPATKKLDAKKIMEVQKALTAVGEKVAINGKLDDATMKALKIYQEKNGLTVTGEADQQTLSSLGVSAN